ncbi:MAG: hypothetical protein HY900_31400 [Deltaproteobacteria bacterium]|nr:hypothetical protein [Deltaproteobacteria bacterium]
MAKAVQATDGFKSAFGRLATHPYNEANPDNSIWWLFPRGRGPRQNWPAYHCGKFVFLRSRGQESIRVGIHVEKGVDSALGSALGTARGRHFVMTDRWIWQSFLADLRTGAFDDALSVIRERSLEGPELRFDVGVPLDERRLTEARTRYRFRSAFGDRTILVSHDPQPHPVPGLERAETLPQVAERLAAFHDGGGALLWIDLVVGLDIPVDRNEGGRGWDAGAIWKNLLEPLAPWVRPGP